jgi:hypothetical protein
LETPGASSPDADAFEKPSKFPADGRLDDLRSRRDNAPMPTYDDALPMRDARRLYFDANGFGEGGYDAKWVTAKMGPIPIAFPNSPQRVRSVRLHDLHHVVTGYATDWTGEAEIGAWEIASNCRDHYAAWVLNLFAMGIGLVIAPGAVWRAFVRGRSSANLYERDFDEAMLDEKVGAMRSRLRVAQAPAARASAADTASFVAWSLAAAGSLLLASAMLLAPPTLLLMFLF